MPGATDPGAPVPISPSTGPTPTPFRRILVALGPGPPDLGATAVVWRILRLLGGLATFCSVELRSTSAAGNEMDGAPANAEETELLHRLPTAVVAGVGPAGADLPIVILHGDPGQRICEYAEFLDVDLIIVGRREKRSFASALKGSVSRYVVGNSRRCVLVLGS